MDLARPVTVDLHTHLFPTGMADLAAETADDRWPSLVVGDGGPGRIMQGSSVFRPVAPTCWDPAARVASMDAAGVDVQILSPVPVTLTTWAAPDLAARFARRQNDRLAEVAASAPDRFRWMGSVPLQDPALAVAEMERACALGMAGVEIGTEVAGRELDDPRFRTFFEAAEDLAVPLFVHPTDGGAIRSSGAPYSFGLGMLTDTALAACALVFGGVLDAYPRLRVALSHGCGTLPWSWPRLRRGAMIGPQGRSPGDLGHLDSLVRRLWVDSLVFDAGHLPLLFSRFGADHVVLGSDFPFYPPTFGAATDVLDDGVRFGTCTAEEAASIRGRNGLRFLDPSSSG
jgi:aminocarboxymuconate-semialdehyde decarboxylase